MRSSTAVSSRAVPLCLGQADIFAPHLGFDVLVGKIATFAQGPEVVLADLEAPEVSFLSFLVLGATVLLRRNSSSVAQEEPARGWSSAVASPQEGTSNRIMRCKAMALPLAPDRSRAVEVYTDCLSYLSYRS